VRTNTFVKVRATGEVGRIRSVDSDVGIVQVDFFDSPFKSVTKSFNPTDLVPFKPEVNEIVWIPVSKEINGKKTRVFHRATFRFETDLGEWAVLLRNLNTERKTDELIIDPEYVTVLSSGPQMDVATCLGEKLTMSSKYAATRQPLLRGLYAQLKVARGYRSILSSGVRPFAHQINTMVRVMSDPIPRFILADEVGLGKTIEAGLVIRQTLIDNPSAKITVICPDFLVGQWTEELKVKLHLAHWIASRNIRIIGFSEFSNLPNSEVVVVDEAHQITSDDNSLIYSEIQTKLKTEATLLLLTATPMRGNRKDYLKLLHLVDPGTYGLSELDKFEARLALREQTARLIDSLRNPSIPREVLIDYLGRLSKFFADDAEFLKITNAINSQIKADDDYLDLQIHLSSYLRENYRIARRVIRNRRDVVAQEGFVVAGRELKDGEPELLEEEYRASIDGFISSFLQKLNLLLSEERIDFEEVIETADPIIEAALSSPEVFAAELWESSVSSDTGTFGEELVSSANQIVKMINDSESSNRWKSVLEVCKRHIQSANSNGVVVFIRNSSVAIRLHQEVSEAFGAHQVSLHLESMSTEEQDSAIRRFKEIGDCRVLIMDKSGEEGRNLQDADEIVHFSLPLSPNRLEQRLGRSDRFKESSKSRAVSRVYLEEFSALSAGQFEYLSKGLNIFERSVATAQQFLSHEFEALFRRLLTDGLDAFSGDCDDIAERLQDEIDSIFSIDEIESSGVPEEFTSLDFEDLLDLDERSDIEDHVLGLFVADRHRTPPTSAIGLYPSPSKWQKQDLTQTMRLAIQTPSGSPIDLHGLDSTRKDQLQRFVLQDREYAFSRPVVRQLPGAYLYRVGDPFVDWVIDYIEGDQLGRTWAVWRRVNVPKPIVMLSGTIKVGLSKDLGQPLTGWGEASAQRRLELALPPQLLHLAVVNGAVINHDDPETMKRFPLASLRDTNFGDAEWLKAEPHLGDFPALCSSASRAMLKTAKQSLMESKDLSVRRKRASSTHESISSVLEIDSRNMKSPTRSQSLERLQDEEFIYRMINETLDNPPVEILSFGLIYMSPDSP
jgi:ATP-dependent helicase HepA